MKTSEVKWLKVKKPASLRTANVREEQNNKKDIAWWNKEGYKKKPFNQRLVPTKGNAKGSRIKQLTVDSS